ncbi:MAG TPA: carboxypeptidase regulatory-like domain-containing protein [Terracidiphilus sp.]|nr:carboxypeptidase regulatory-like domain-containing protein [Terracidiphilus sp.]
MTFKARFLGPLLLFSLFVCSDLLAAQAGTLEGAILDPSGAAVPGAEIECLGVGKTFHARSGSDGHYAFRSLAPGTYSLTAWSAGFARQTIEGVSLSAGQIRQFNITLQIAVQQQSVSVAGQAPGVSIDPDQNASALVLRGRGLDILSDDPNELRNELEALAGPAAGPSGGQIYIDGFAGGKLPPKSSILEVRVNQNPFSAEFDRLGYGRVEVITRPGSQKLQGILDAAGNTSALDTANPLVAQQPSYYQYVASADLSGPIGKNASWFLSTYRISHQDQAIVNALNPQNPGANIAQAFSTPITYLLVDPRIDIQVGANNTVTIRDRFYRTRQDGSGVGALDLPSLASSVLSDENQLQVADTILINSHFVNETHFQWSRIANHQAAANFTPTVTVQGAFTTGGSSSGVARDRQNNFELQNVSTATAGEHTLRFGMRLRAYNDVSYSTAGANGSYFFGSVDAYQAATPSQYSAAIIANPLAKAVLFDGSFFLQDDWRWKPNFILCAGLRLEGQNRIHDRADWAPRLALVWSPGKSVTANRPRTIVRAGYGWFYNRFTVPNFFSTDSGTPYILQTIHDNRINQESYVVDNPAFYDPNTAEPSAIVAAGGTPSYHTIDPHFHAALDMQGGIGVDRQLTQKITANLTYLYTQGIHQYLTNNVSAPEFNPATYTVSGPLPGIYNYQFQSGGVYRQNQLILTVRYQSQRWILNGYYLLNAAKSDTQGVNFIPSVAENPGLDYGRASFGYRHKLVFADSYNGPYGILIAAMLFARSGLPYNLTVGNDLTANNQFNARPSYGICGQAGVVATQYGCLDTNPVGKGEKIVPYGLGTGPANVIVHLRLSKVVGIGPRIGNPGEGDTFNVGSGVSERGLSSGRAAIRVNESAPRRYSLTMAAVAANLFNMVNLAPPNGVLLSPLFGKSQSLAGGGFGSQTPGNRAITFQTTFSF